ncbi:MAG: hypothetical protein WDN24_09245 [Sphingomonas sp.]
MAEPRDRRTARTRGAIVGAINRLLMSGRRRQRDIRVADIVAEARVGRSTFYDHYPSADAVFLEAARHPFGQLADALTGRCDAGALTGLLEHFWENRRLARDTLDRLDAQVVRLLADLIEERLGAAPLAIPTRLAALQLAQAGLAPIRGWVLAEAPCSAQMLAESLHRTGAAMRAALAVL